MDGRTTSNNAVYVIQRMLIHIDIEMYLEASMEYYSPPDKTIFTWL